MNNILYLFSILFLVSIFYLFNSSTQTIAKENFENYTLAETTTNYAKPSSPLMPVNRVPTVETNVLLQGDYPITGVNGISNNGANDIWKNYPIVEVGSYDQVTNNMKNIANPDEGTCMPASMCGALYKNKSTGSNTITPLPPVNNTCGTRIGYFTTNQNLLPFTTDNQNILY